MRAHHAFLRLRMIHERHEELALEVEQPLLVDLRGRLDVAAAHHIGDAAGDEEVVLADETAVAHVDQLRLDRRHTAAASDRKGPRLERRTVAGRMHREGLADRGPQHFVGVEYDEVGLAQVTHRLGLERRLRHVGHGGVQEPVLHEREHVGHAGRLRRLRRAQRALLEAARPRNQADADFDEPDVAFERGDRPRAMQDQFAATAERHAADGGDGRHLRVLQAHERVLHLLLFGADRLGAPAHEHRHHGMQVGADRERIIYSASARSTAFSRPLITPGPIAWTFVLIDRIRTSAICPPSSVHRRTASSS